MKVYFGVDVGGTQIKFGAFSENGNIMDNWAVDTDLSDSGSRVIPGIARQIRSYISDRGLKDEDIAGVGMGIPGPVDKTGFIPLCPNMFWKNANPVKELQAILGEGPAIAAANDANCAALGEYHKGAGAEHESVFLVTLGTGVGGGVVIDGKILIGAKGLGGEIGHIGISPEMAENKCNCGNKGCIDQISSANGLVRTMKWYLKKYNTPSCLRDFIGDFTSKHICDAASAGDELAVRCLNDCMGVLGRGLAYMSHVVDPEVFIIGGGMSKAGEMLIEPIIEGYKKHVFLTDVLPRFRLATLGNDAGIIGAAYLVM